MEMDIKKHIAPEHWMRNESLVRIFSLLQGDSPDASPQALLVGGCVRNVLLGKRVDDVDIATPLMPDEVIKRLNGDGIKVIPTGIDHGTVTAVIDGNPYEITTLRHDLETDGRRAVVGFTQSWIEDARRRDFTINTLLMDLKGNVYDPLGQGIEDIESRIVRFVGKPEQRIEEDYLRILRFFRFTALYANGFDEEGLKACQKLSAGIDHLSKERVTQEFFKIIASDDPAKVIKIMFEHNILKTFDFESGDFEFFAAFCGFQKRYNLSALSSRLFVFARMAFQNVQKMERYILFPKVFLKDMRCISGALNLRDLDCDSAVREAIYRFGRSMTAQALMIELAQDRVVNRYAPQALNIIQNWDIPVFPLSGHDLMEAGIEKGPELGKTLDALESYWIENDFKPEKEELMDYLKKSRPSNS